ncbi:CDP-diacylglycerol--glycerol-3-phosphate 3-phosphatidyltransferase [Anaerosalibacter massiliensis]|uniref:CDP-diacylglycerol--glycerol-3-phosphate 3-phosphatidyltransferase n=1 Tax=Anaerosalibacter massiliensis TaxID=1347392 RepID=A0A9X2MFH0_9FIRM|nr:CDP-diacylglycerol--glycerol-3-phosphate 3-phosphatidyltransferase [Anaerosalibacter massiliensis]MCR2042714.1 CDP-diacylglycerol--glycerol-3-phosphate 3-phosphatidyltransferase [Anaerosalibacter massiliensis]
MNLANKITLFRVVLIPIFMFFLLSNISNGQYIAAAIFIIASLTDTLDGYIARSRNQVTNFGKFMDPLADKLLVSAALISLVELKRVPAWMVVVIIAREFAITGLRVIAASEGVTIAASSLGKIKTITQLVAVIAILFNIHPFDTIMLYTAVFFTILSGIDYIRKNKKVLHSGER